MARHARAARDSGAKPAALTVLVAVQFLQLREGDVNGDFVGVPASQLAVFPGTTHFNGLARTDLVLDVVRPFLAEPPAAG
jgi:hypothetical protein